MQRDKKNKQTYIESKLLQGQKFNRIFNWFG